VVKKQEIEKRIAEWASKNKLPWFNAFQRGRSLPSQPVDSLEIIRFVSYLQNEFSVSISPADFFGGAFDDMGTLAEYLERKEAK